MPVDRPMTWDELVKALSIERQEAEKLRQENERLTKDLVAQTIETRNNYCPCCHARLDEICGPCKFCADSKTHLDTERSMYQAWRKRAEEAEKENEALRTRQEKLVEALKKIAPYPNGATTDETPSFKCDYYESIAQQALEEVK